jgi:anti-anti-sigma regulatory factor
VISPDSMNKKINFTFEQFSNVGIFNLNGELTSEHEDELKLLLMRAIHSLDRAVLNMKKVSRIDLTCFNLLRKAYCTSLRLKNPIILTEVPRDYINDIYICDIEDASETNWSPDYQGSSI